MEKDISNLKEIKLIIDKVENFGNIEKFKDIENIEEIENDVKNNNLDDVKNNNLNNVKKDDDIKQDYYR